MTKPISLYALQTMMKAYAPGEMKNPPTFMKEKTRQPKQYQSDQDTPNKKREHPEDDIQIECYDYLKELELTNQDIRAYSIPNHFFKGFRHRSEQKRWWAFINYMNKEKRKGLRKGVSDLCIIFRHPTGFPMPCFAEIKDKGKYPDPDQKVFMKDMESLGCKTAIVRSLEDLQKFLKEAGYARLAE